MAHGSPAPAARGVAIGGERTRVVVDEVPGGISVRVTLSIPTRAVWLVMSLSFAIPTVGCGIVTLLGISLAFSEDVAVGAVVATVAALATLVLFAVTYRMACTALNTVRIEATREHLWVTGSPLPPFGALDIPVAEVSAITVDWPGGAAALNGASWTLTAHLRSTRARPIVKNLSSRADAEALQTAILDHLGIVGTMTSFTFSAGAGAAR
jgi:hypothetical protein